MKGPRPPLASNIIPAKVAVHSVVEVKKRTRDAANAVEKKLGDARIPSAAELVSIISKIVSAYFSLASFRASATLKIFDTLPKNHYESPFVLTLVAKAHFELHHYQQASAIFKKIRQLDPTRTEAMDIYATCLWHLKKKVELSSLGKKLEELDNKAPETWCVIGNYFSVLQEHDSAILAFKRALQVDPFFTYASTLLGHEYLSNEDLDSASKSFKFAIRINHRHFNAIYGLGLIERKQEKYSLAEYYFRQALEITPENSILLDSLASVVQKDMSRFEEALQIYDRALSIAPGHRIYALHRAQHLFSMQDYEGVVQAIEKEVLNSKPESSVYFLLGRAYAELGKSKEALLAMTLAQDYLEHKSSSIIKDAIDKLLTQTDGSESQFSNV